MYSHRSRHREWPSQLHSDNCTLLGYWEINGVKAHCLLDSRSEGVLLSLELMCKIFTLLSRFLLITVELEPDIFDIKGVLNDSCDGL